MQPYQRPADEFLNQDLPALKDRIRTSLRHFETDSYRGAVALDSTGASAVLFLLGRRPDGDRTPALILNKRSAKVRQPGDLCCPGGSIAPRRDRLLAMLLRGPLAPLFRRQRWPAGRQAGHHSAFPLSVLLATGLRESFEEMRLNPFKVEFLGPLPPQQLLMFQRTIYPLVCWVRGRQRFSPNWEVEKIVYLPLRRLLDPSAYGRLRLEIRDPENGVDLREFPCFMHRQSDESERLWGATFRITMVFLERVFAFRPPPLQHLPLFKAALAEEYLTGAR